MSPPARRRPAVLAGLLLGLAAAAGAEAPPALPGRGLAQHPFLYCGQWDTRKPEQTIFLVRGGQVVWSYAISKKGDELSDCTMLSNGHVMFARKGGASEVTPDKRIVWNYDAPPGTEVHTAQPIGNDRALVMLNGDPARLMILRKKDGRVEKSLVLPTAHPDKVHGQFRHVRRTRAGTFLAAHLDLGKVVEYDQSGKAIWSVDAPSAWSAVRLRNGHTLIGGNQHGWVREVNAKGEIVWEIGKDDLPGIPLHVVQEVSRLASGNTVICNWSGFLPKADWPSVVQVIEVTPGKKVVWALRSWTDPDLGPSSTIQLLDEPGAAERGDLQR